MAGVVIVMTIVVFLVGMVVGIITALAVVARREDRMHPPVGKPENRIARYARLLSGLGHGDMARDVVPPGDALPH